MVTDGKVMNIDTSINIFVVLLNSAQVISKSVFFRSKYF